MADFLGFTGALLFVWLLGFMKFWVLYVTPLVISIIPAIARKRVVYVLYGFALSLIFSLFGAFVAWTNFFVGSSFGF